MSSGTLAPLGQPRRKLLARKSWQVSQLTAACILTTPEVEALTLGLATCRRCCSGVVGLSVSGTAVRRKQDTADFKPGGRWIVPSISGLEA